MRVPLQRVAHIRAGDKGNTSNVSVIAYELALFPVLEEQLTVARVLARYGDRIAGPATRYVVAPLGAMNFVLQGALGGGVSRTLSQDNFGKALGSALLDIELDVDDSLAGLLRGPA